MEADKVCRVCLVMGVKMYDVKSYPVKKYLEAIVGVNALGDMLLPTYICYECEALAKKYFFFKERCIKGQAALFDMLSIHGKVNVAEIAQLRKTFKLSSTLRLVVQTNLIDCCYDESNRRKESRKKDIFDVKDEPYEDSSIQFAETLEADDLLETIKEEDDYKFEVFLNSAESVSSDDEPLSMHKRNKTEKENKKESLDEIPSVPVKRKRGRPRKDEVLPKADGSDPQHKPPRKRTVRRRVTDNTGGVSDQEDFDLEQYVEIIHLTPEEQIQEIEKRKESSNYQNSAFQCNFCYKGFIDAQAWKHHSAKHDPSAGNISCPICKIRFKNKRAYMKHYMNHEKKYQCKACPYVSKTSTQAKQHQRWHKGVTYKCQHCDEISTKWTSYLSHVRMKHPSEFICGVCGYSFVSRLGLAMHRTMMHKGVEENQEPEGEVKEDDSRPYCSVCDVRFVSEEAFKRHMVMSTKHTKTDEESHGCRACGSRFPSAEALRAHGRAAHARRRPKNYGKRPPPYSFPAPCEHVLANGQHKWLKDYGKRPPPYSFPAPCEHCGEQVPSGRAYWTHFRRAHPGLPYPVRKDYVCDICGKSFRGNAFLVYHKRTHTDERAYKCSLCPKAFHNRTNLQMHQKTHSDHRPHPCTVCFKAFKSKGALDRHFRSHTGVKPYECEVCGKAFNQSNSRKLHVRTVHLRQPAPYVSRNRDKRRPPPEHF